MTRKRERIEHANGVYIARREPEVATIGGDEPCVIVKFTHDIGRAAELAWPAWQELYEDRRLGRPRLDWGRRVNWDMVGDGYAWTWLEYEKPGNRGVIPVVVFKPGHATRDDFLTPAAWEAERDFRARMTAAAQHEDAGAA